MTTIRGVYVLAFSMLALIGLCAWASPVMAMADDGFGTYFTAHTPTALESDTTTPATIFANDFTAEELSNIAPAAGEESIFILPDESWAVETTPDGSALAVPPEPRVPGMTHAAEQPAIPASSP